MFEYEGNEFSLEELQAAAKGQNIDFNMFMGEMRKRGLTATKPIYRQYFPSNSPSESGDMPEWKWTDQKLHDINSWWNRNNSDVIKAQELIEKAEIGPDVEPLTEEEIEETSKQLNVASDPYYQELDAKLKETQKKDGTVVSKEASDLSKEMDRYKEAVSEPVINPNYKKFEEQADIVRAHEEEAELIEQRIRDKYKDAPFSPAALEEIVAALKKHNESGITLGKDKGSLYIPEWQVQEAKWDIKAIEEGLNAITTIRPEDFVGGFKKKRGTLGKYTNKEEQFELSSALRKQMIEDLSIKDFQRAQQGYLTGEEKDALISASEFKIIEKEIAKANEIWESSRFLDFKKEKENIENKLKAMSKYDDMGELLPFETQEEVDIYNDLVTKANAIDAEGLKLENIVKASQERLETLYAELGYNAMEGVFNNNFAMTNEYEEWRDKHLKAPKGTSEYKQGVIKDAVGTFVQEGLKLASDATIGTSLWLANYGYSKFDKNIFTGEEKGGKYYNGNDLLNDIYKKYTRANYLGVSDKDVISSWDAIKKGDVRSMSKVGAEGIPYIMGLVIAARNGNVKPVKNLWSSIAPKFLTSAKGRSHLRMMNASVRMQGIGEYHEGLTLGLNQEQAMGYSVFKSIGVAALERVMPDPYFFKSGAGKAMINGVVNNLSGAATKKAVGSAVKQGIVNMLKEQPEEFLQLVWGDVAKLNAGIHHSPDFLNEEVVKETVAGTLILTGSIAPVGSIKNYRDVKKQVYSQYKERGQEVMTAIDDELRVAEEYLKKAKSKSAKDQYQTIVDQLNETKSYGQSIINAINSAPAEVSDAQIDFLIAKQKLVKEKEGKDKAAVAGIDEQIKALDEKIANSAIRQREARITGEIKTTIEEAIEKGDLKGSITEMTSEEISNIEEEGFDSKTAAKEHGFIAQNPDGSFNIILNKDKEMVGTAAHEFLHAVLFKTIGNDTETQNKLGDALIKHAVSLGGDQSTLGQRLSAYGKWDGDTFIRDDNFGEEVITVMSESIVDGSLKFEENLFTRIGNSVRRFLQNVGVKKIKFDTGKDVFNFVKDYSKNVKEGKIGKAILNVAEEGVEGELVERADPKAGVQMSKVNQRTQQFLDLNIDNKSLVDITEAQQSTTEDRFAAYDALIEKNWPVISKALKFNPTGNIPMRAVKDAINEQMLGIFPRVILPSGKSIARKTPLFKTYNKETAVTTFLDATLRNRQAEIFTRAKAIGGVEQMGVDISEAKGVAAPELAETTVEKRKPKTNVLKIGKVKDKAEDIKKIVKVKKNDTFKEVSDKNTGPVAEMIFDVPADKIIDPKKNLTYAKKIVDGIPEASEAGNIQNFYATGDAMNKLIRILPKENVSSKTADINELGENIDVDPNVLGRGLGLSNRMLNLFYNKTDRRSKGKKSQPFIWELKPEFVNPTPETVQRIKEEAGITPRGELNNYNRNIGQLLKGLAKFQAQQTALSAAQRNLAEARAPKKQIASITTAQSKLAFRKAEKTKVDNLMDFIVSPDFESDIANTNSLLKTFIKKGKYVFNSEASVNEFYNDVENVLIPTLPKGYITKRILRPSNRVLGANKDKIIKVNGKKITIDQYYTQKRNDLLNKKDLIYGKPFTGKAVGFKPQAYGKVFGNSAKSFEKANKEGEIKEFNDINESMHRQLWQRVNESIKENKENARIWGSYFSTVSLITEHPHRLGAEFVGWSINPRGYNDKLYEWEHAMPASRAYLYLFESILDPNFNFDLAYDLVMNNYKLVALDNYIDKTSIKKAGRTTSMGKGWSIISDTWLDRYFKGDIDIDARKIIGLNGKNFEDIYSIPRLKPGLEANKTINKAKIKARTYSFSKSPKGITVLDFDDTLATTKSLVRFTAPDGTKGTLNAEQYAAQYQDLLEQGYTFDFTEFDKVVKGKLAPLFNKALKLQGKFGPDNMFVLTARPPAAQKAIFDFLKANGLNIPLKNITGLGNSTSEAKALWVADKVGEGYNDFYFADDALQNVQAVKNMLDQFDVKSKIQQAKVKFSRSINKDFNDILENVTGIESEKRFSAIKARKRGANKGKFRFFIPPSHEDFVGLLYNFIGKGKKGNEHRDFFEKALVKPLNNAYRELNTAKQSIANDYKSLNKQFEDVKNKLTKKTPDGDFTYQDAIRVYLWNKHGYKAPGLSKTDQQGLVDLVTSDPEIQAYAETLNVISKQDAYVNPTESWEAGDIRTDLDDATGRVGREQYFNKFWENADIIFSQENLNKIEAAYGANVVSAIKDILYRTKTGRNRPSGQNKLVNQFMNYLNGSVASTMFFNIRSAVLQQMSMVNFINYADNNVFSAAKAFANQPQYWKDWATIFNSDFMKQRRGGIKTDVNGAELAASLRGAKNTPRALLAKLLELGFLPTQIGDNIAIATGGSTFYRNRINTYLKQGMTQKEAESKAWIDFQVLAEATQQSARPDMVSQQQASPLGKIILAFQNVTSQFNRLGKKAFLDLKNRRITPGNTTQIQSDISNISRIGYYLALQNLIFYSLQTALFTALFDDDDDDERWLGKKERMINGSIDSVLRGTGVWGAAVSTLKNMAIKWYEQRDKGWNKDESAVLMEMLNVSPPLGIKARKMVNAEKTLNYNKKVIDEMETFDIDNPTWSAVTNIIEATTNAPTNRLYNKTQNVRQSLNSDHEAWQRVLMFSGWSQWNLGIGDTKKIEEVKKTIKKKKEKEKKKKKKKKKFKTFKKFKIKTF